MIKKYGILARRNGTSILGFSESWCKENENTILFDTYDKAAAHASKLREFMANPHIEYFPKEYN